MKRLVCLLCALCLLAGCAGSDPAPSPADGAVAVYYPTDWAASDAQESLVEPVWLVPGGDPIPFCLAKLTETPAAEGLRPAFPAGVRALSHTLSDGVLTLNMSAEFLALTGGPLTVTEACAALTLCALPGVSEVAFQAEGVPYPAAGKSRFTAADFTGETLVLVPVETPVILYFFNEDTEALTPETHLIAIRENEHAERYVLEVLFKGPNDTSLSSALPEGTRLLGVSLEAGVCYVNLPATFYATPPPFGHATAIKAITNSLTLLAEVDAVQFLQEGDPAPQYGDQNLETPVGAN
ncbi:MAG: GerMN domain-containing protein [Oscillospiraceae bacterium]|jgi:spore germination protein GerM|nr:GerMN domain-containing protein [Oscillospiraceae bacterium]